jgi:subtilisin family serine protease/subtilisin-like proprotein convertase family protein
MSDITLMRGGKEVRFKKMPHHFAVKFKRGMQADGKALARACNRLKAEVKNVDSARQEGFEILSIKKSSELEASTEELRRAPESDVVTHLYTMDNYDSGGVIPTGTMLVQFKMGVSDEEQVKILDTYGLEILEQLDYVDGAVTVKLTGKSKENPLKIAAHLQQMEEVKEAEPDLSFQVSFKHIPSDSLYRKQWHLNNRGDLTGLVEGADVKAEAAWEYTTGTRDITVCVMDDGFDLDHPDLKGTNKIVAPMDFGGNDTDPRPGGNTDKHGTSCAGVAIAEQNGEGVVGLAPGCAFMPVRMSPWLSDQAVVSFFQHAIDHHADVISCSWAANSPSFPLSARIKGIIHKAAVQGRRNGKGCVILFAAGNEDSPLDGEKNGVTYHQGFALHPDVLAVAASNSMDKRSYYSNYGPELCICAPSDGSPGRGIVTTDRMGALGYSRYDYTYDFGGTSSATPLAAGLAALMLSLNPDLTSAEVKTIMMNTADKIDRENGHYAEGHSPLYGHGRINAHEALAYIDGDTTVPTPEVLLMEHRINKAIPDQGEIMDTITFPVETSTRAIEVNVDIRHTWSGDIKLTLLSPQGEEIVLQEAVGAGVDDIVKSYRSDNMPEMFKNVIEKPANGVWKLKVEDLQKQDVGVLRKWGLAITY